MDAILCGAALTVAALAALIIIVRLALRDARPRPPRRWVPEWDEPLQTRRLPETLVVDAPLVRLAPLARYPLRPGDPVLVQTNVFVLVRRPVGSYGWSQDFYDEHRMTILMHVETVGPDGAALSWVDPRNLGTDLPSAGVEYIPWTAWARELTWDRVTWMHDHPDMSLTPSRRAPLNVGQYS